MSEATAQPVAESCEVAAGVAAAPSSPSGSAPPAAFALRSSQMEMKDMDFATMSEEDFQGHPLYLRESVVWKEEGWTWQGYEPGPTCDTTHIRLACPEGHPKTVGAGWYLNQGSGFGRPAMFKCKFCADKDGVIEGFLAFKRLDYVLFNPRPGVDFRTFQGRVSKVNKKSLQVMTADGKTHAVKDLTAIKPSPNAPAREIRLIKNKKSEMQKLA